MVKRKVSGLQNHLNNFAARQVFVDAGLSEWFYVTYSLIVAKGFAAEGIMPSEYAEILDKASVDKDVMAPDWWGNWKRQMGNQFTVEAALREMRRMHPAPMRTR